MLALLYLKHAFNESDEEVIQCWGETPTWQYFSGNDNFEHQWPCDPIQLGRLRKALGEEGEEELLARARGGVHLQRQEPQPLRVWCEGGSGHGAQGQPDRGR